jgi:pimeloyl-ACP methyl ester carboxylesterase
MWPGTEVDVDGTSLFVRVTPGPAGAEPALLVHGLGGSAVNWTDFAALLGEHLAVESVDLPGHGRSGPPPRSDYRLGAHARAVIGYLDQSGRGPVHLVGNSMGGAVSILVAAQRPDLVRTLTLISPAVPDTKKLRAHALRGDPRMALLILPGIGNAAMRRLSALPIEQRVKGTIRLVFADPKRVPAERLDELISEAKERQSMPWANSAFLRSLRGLVRSQFNAGEAWTALRSIKAPTLVIWGDKDRLVSPALAQEVADAVEDSRLLVLDDVGHTAMMERPEKTARAVLDMIAETAARS